MANDIDVRVAQFEELLGFGASKPSRDASKAAAWKPTMASWPAPRNYRSGSRRGRRTLAHQPRGQYQRDHSDRRARRAAVAAYGFFRCRHPAEADLGRSRAAAAVGTGAANSVRDAPAMAELQLGDGFLGRDHVMLSGRWNSRRVRSCRRPRGPVHARRRVGRMPLKQVKSWRTTSNEHSRSRRVPAASVLAGAREAQTTLVTASADAANHVKSLATSNPTAAVGADTASSILKRARGAKFSAYDVPPKRPDRSRRSPPISNGRSLRLPPIPPTTSRPAPSMHRVRLWPHQTKSVRGSSRHCGCASAVFPARP